MGDFRPMKSDFDNRLIEIITKGTVSHPKTGEVLIQHDVLSQIKQLIKSEVIGEMDDPAYAKIGHTETQDIYSKLRNDLRREQRAKLGES